MNHSHTRSQTIAALAAAEPDAPSSGIRALIGRHPVAAYLIMVFTGLWLSLVPTLFLNASTWPPPFPFDMIGSILVFALPPLLVTAIIDGRAGVRDLLARALRWRVGPRWYALALLGLPVGMFLLATTFLGTAPSPRSATSGRSSSRRSCRKSCSPSSPSSSSRSLGGWASCSIGSSTGTGHSEPASWWRSPSR